MHDCFQIPELLDKICGEVMDYDDIDRSSRSLAKMAQTCKLFTEPALNAVYFEIQGVDRLFMLFPRNAWRMNRNAFTFRRQLMLSDWEIFNANSHRIKIFGQPKDSVRFQKHIFEAVCLPPHLPLLPNLRAFFWGANTNLPGYFIRSLCGPNVAILGMREIPPKFFALVSAISGSCSGLRKLYVHTRHNADVGCFRRVLMEALPHMSSLRLLHLDIAPDCSLLGVISKLAVQDLTIRSFESSHTPEQCVNRKNHWVSLRSLRLVRASWHSIPTLLDHLGYMPNVSILKYLDVEGRRMRFKTLLQASNRHFNPSALSFFTLQEAELGQSGGRDPDEDVNMTDNIEDMNFSFLIQMMNNWVHLQKLVIRANLMPHLDDDAVSRLANAFPSLRVFHVQSRSIKRLHPGDMSLVTFNALDTLLTRCPMLESINLVLNAAIPYRASRSKVSRNTRIITLGLGDSPIEDPIYVASILRYLLPRLRNVRASCHAERRRELWKQVNLIVLGNYAQSLYEKELARAEEEESIAEAWLPSTSFLEASSKMNINFNDEYKNDGIAFW